MGKRILLGSLGALVLLFGLLGDGFAAEEANFGHLRELAQQADLLEATKRVRRLEAEIAELEAKARERLQTGQGQEKLVRLVAEQVQRFLRPQGAGQKPKASLPRVVALERGARGVFSAELCWPDGQRLRVRPRQQYRGLTILAISRERVLVRAEGRVCELAFAH